MKQKCECGNDKWYVLEGECVENGVGVYGGMCTECGKVFEGVQYNKDVKFTSYNDEYIVYIEDQSEERGCEQVVYDCVEVETHEHEYIQVEIINKVYDCETPNMEDMVCGIHINL